MLGGWREFVYDFRRKLFWLILSFLPGKKKKPQNLQILSDVKKLRKLYVGRIQTYLVSFFIIILGAYVCFKVRKWLQKSVSKH